MLFAASYVTDIDYVSLFSHAKFKFSKFHKDFPESDFRFSDMFGH